METLSESEKASELTGIILPKNLLLGNPVAVLLSGGFHQREKMRTLVQVLKVITGILILTLLAGGAYFYADILELLPRSQKLSRIDADFNAIGSSLKTYHLNAGFYPTTEQGLDALVNKPESTPVPRKWTKIADRRPTDPWNSEYRYRRFEGGDPSDFELRSAGRDGIFGTKDDNIYHSP
jgi:general secretion pathway protein G